MKKTIVYFSAVVFIAVLSFSCKTKEHCPAYGMKTEMQKAQRI